MNENLKSKDDLMKNNDLIKIELEKTKKENQVLLQRNTENENQYNQLKTSLEEKGNEIKKLNEINKNLEEKNKHNENIMNKANEKLKQFELINKDQDEEITDLRSQVKQMKKIQNKELEIDKKEKDLEDKEKSLNERYNEWAKININLESNISSLENKKKKLFEEIKKYGVQLDKEKHIKSELNLVLKGPNIEGDFIKLSDGGFKLLSQIIFKIVARMNMMTKETVKYRAIQ